MKCLSVGFKANSHLCQELVDNSCGVIIIDCAGTTSVTLENRLESENHSLTLKFMKTAALANTQEFSMVVFLLLLFLGVGFFVCFFAFFVCFFFYFFKTFSFLLT